jgi:pimeloyl-ACP methyl ester carboxylesterase
MLTGTAQVDPLETVRATVHAGRIRMDYWHAGRGSPLLLLRGRDDGEAAPRTPWLSTLTRSFRVLAPDLLASTGAEARPAVATCLRGFLDGLGLERVAVVTDGSTAAEVLWLALSEPERVDRIVIVIPEDADPECPDGLAAERFEQSRQPILIVRMNPPDAPASAAYAAAEQERMLHFLSGDA